jgi:hypothetical protein
LRFTFPGRSVTVFMGVFMCFNVHRAAIFYLKKVFMLLFILLLLSKIRNSSTFKTSKLKCCCRLFAFMLKVVFPRFSASMKYRTLFLTHGIVMAFHMLLVTSFICPALSNDENRFHFLQKDGHSSNDFAKEVFWQSVGNRSVKST